MDQLEPGVSVCSEWTGRRQGSVDFYIPGAKWAIQLPRDGNQPKEHCDRFTTGGIYTHGLWGGTFKIGWSWTFGILSHENQVMLYIIPCVWFGILTDSPGATTVQDGHLWRIILKKDYSSFRILNFRNQELYQEFCLEKGSLTMPNSLFRWWLSTSVLHKWKEQNNWKVTCVVNHIVDYLP